MNRQTGQLGLLGLTPEAVSHIARELDRIHRLIRNSGLNESFRSIAARSFPFRPLDLTVLESLRETASAIRTVSAPSPEEKPGRSAVPTRRRRGRPPISSDEADLKLIADCIASELEQGEFEASRKLKSGDVRRAKDRLRHRSGGGSGVIRKKRPN